MDLGLDIVLKPGRPPEEEAVPAFVRALTAKDIERLWDDHTPRNNAPALKRITERHHALARALASGMKDWEAGMVVGYHVCTISILKNDPSFKELILFYRENKDAAFRQVHDQMAALSKDVVDSLHDDLEADKLSPGQKIEVARLTLDRTGHGPASTATHNHVHTVNVAERAQAARKRLLERQGIIDITPTEVVPPEEQEDAA